MKGEYLKAKGTDFVAENVWKSTVEGYVQGVRETLKILEHKIFVLTHKDLLNKQIKICKEIIKDWEKKK